MSITNHVLNLYYSNESSHILSARRGMKEDSYIEICYYGSNMLNLGIVSCIYTIIIACFEYMALSTWHKLLNKTYVRSGKSTSIDPNLRLYQRLRGIKFLLE